MSTREFCLARRKSEIPTFVKVLKAVPQGRSNYRPDPKSRTAAELAGLLAYEEAALLSLLETGTVQWKDQPAPTQMADVVASFERSAQAVTDRLARAGEVPLEQQMDLWGSLTGVGHAAAHRELGRRVP